MIQVILSRAESRLGPTLRVPQTRNGRILFQIKSALDEKQIMCCFF